MAKNPKNNDACNVLAAAISKMGRNGGGGGYQRPPCPVCCIQCPADGTTTLPGGLPVGQNGTGAEMRLLLP